MTEIQKLKILHFFNVLDQDNNGVLEEADFERVSEKISDLRNLDANATERLILGIKAHGIFVQVLKDLDKQTAYIRKDEWLKFFERQILSRSELYVDKVSDYLFSIFDQDDDGYINEEEFTDMFKAYGLFTSQSKKAFESLDLNSDGQLSKEEMAKAFEEYFFSKDEYASGNWIFGNWKNEIPDG